MEIKMFAKKKKKKTRQITTLPFLDSMERCDLTSFCEEEKNLSNHTINQVFPK